jgi:hypothetical protein
MKGRRMNDITVEPWLDQEALQVRWTMRGAFPCDAGYLYPAASQPRPGTVVSALVDDQVDTDPCSFGG